MGVRRQSSSRFQLPAKILKLLFAKAALHKGSSIYTGGGVGLGHKHVATIMLVPGAEKMLEAYFQHRRRRSVGGNMATHAGTLILPAQHHSHGIPAHDILNFLFQFNIAWIGRLLGHRDSIDIGRVKCGFAQYYAAGKGMILQCPKNIARTRFTKLSVDCIQGLSPLPAILRQCFINCVIHFF